MTNPQDLLPSSVLKRRLVLSGMRFWGLVWLVISFAVSTHIVRNKQQTESLETVAVQAAEQSAPIQKLQLKQKELEKQIAKIHQRESWLTESDSSQTLALMGIISGAAESNQGRINVQNLRLTSIERPIADAEPKKGKPVPNTKAAKRNPQFEQRMQLNLNGYAVNDLAVAAFISVLRDANVFESVELRSSDSQVFNEHETRQYDLTCIY